MRRRFLLASSASEYPNAPLPNQVTSRATFLPFTDGANDFQGRFTPLVMDDGNWMGVWFEGVDHSDYNGATQKYNIAFSDDEGATWTDNNEYLDGNPVSGWPLVPPTASTGFVDCNLIKCPNGDIVLIAQNRGSNPGVWNNVNFSQHQYRSTDNGQTWSYEFDFCNAIGFTTTAQKAKIQGNYENMVVGSTVYIILCEVRTDLNDTRISLYKSTDNCATYSLVSHVVEFDEANPDCTESSIADLGNGIFFCVLRTQNLGQAVWKRSEDYGLTWGALTEFSSLIGYVGVHQPHVQRFANFFLLSGRDQKQEQTSPTNTSLYDRCSFWTTTDLFATACRRQYLDPFYGGLGVDDTTTGDSGYAKGILKSDGTFMFFGYHGTTHAARIYKYEASNTGSPSEEQYSNTAFFPETISSNGWRLQLNRDNLFPVASSPVLGGEAIFSRAHDTLLTGSTRSWLAGGTNRPEFTVINNKGWAIFDGTGFFSSQVSMKGLYRASFSIGFWVLPDDGQPAATQVLVRDSSSATGGTLDDRVQITLQTSGRIAVGYHVNTVGGTAETANVIFSNGAATTPVHIAATFTSGGLIRIYVDGVLQGYNGSNTGDMSGATMASYGGTTATYVGIRQLSSTPTYDLGFVGKMREVICQPVVWNTDDIADIMLN